MKRLLIFLLVALFVCPASADLVIPKTCHVANEEPGFCSWVCLDILGRVHKIKKLEGICTTRKKEYAADKNDIIFDFFGNPHTYPKHMGYDFSIKEKLKALEVRFWLQPTGGINRDLLKYADSHGCVVGVKVGAIK